MYFNGEELYSDKNFHFGGTNLITGTSNFDGFTGVGTLQNSRDVFGNKQVLINNLWNSYVKLFNVFAGQIVCFSLIVQATNNAKPHLGMYCGDSKYGGTATVENSTTIGNCFYVDNVKMTAFTPSDNNPHILHCFFKVTSNGLLNPRVESSDGNPWLASSYKAELGTIRTNWSPAPADLVSKSDFDALKAKVDLLTKN